MWGLYTRRVILLVQAGDVAAARATAVALWGVGQHFSSRHNGAFALNAACTEAQAAIWRAAINTYTGARWYIVDAESNRAIESNSPFPVRESGWQDVTEDLARVRSDHYVTVDGAGDGSAGNPFSLAAALSSSIILPGDTVHLAAGMYRGDYVVGFKGRADKPIAIRGAGLWASRITDSFRLNDYVYAVNLRISYPDWTTRTSQQVSSNPTDLPQAGAGNGALYHAARAGKAIGCLMDNNRVGGGFWLGAIDAEFYGCWWLHNGWRGPDRTHGPDLYYQNDTGRKTVRACLFAASYWHGMYMVSTSAPMRNITNEDNVTIQAFTYLASHQPGENIIHRRNWHGANSLVYCGGFGVRHKSLLFENNDILLNPEWYNGLVIDQWEDFTLRGNRIAGNAASYPVIAYHPIKATGNRYWYTLRAALPGAPFQLQQQNRSWEQWQAAGYDADGSYSETVRPLSYKVVPVLDYGLRQWHVAIDNPAGVNVVSVDMAGQGLEVGRTYRAYNGLDFEDWREFVYAGGAVAFDMRRREAIPLGDTATRWPECWPQSGAFVVREL